MNQNIHTLYAGTAWPDTAPAEAKDPTTFAELLLAFRRQRLILALCIFAGLAAGFAHYATSPKKYYASATILVNERQSDLSGEISSSLPFMRNDTALLNEMQVLRSLNLAERVVASLGLLESDAFLSPPSSLAGQMKRQVFATVKGLIPSEPATEGSPAPVLTEAERISHAAEALRYDIGIERVGLSFSIDISYLSTDPALAANVVNAYAEAYMADQMSANQQASGRTAQWMSTRLEELRQSANAAAVDAQNFRAENRAMDQQGIREREQRAESLNALYTTLLERYEEIALEGSFPVTNGRILSFALQPTEPALPKHWQLLSLGLVLGALAGLGLAVLREMREQGFRTVDDVRAATSLPSLGYLPTFKERRLSRRRPSEPRLPSDVPAVAFASGRVHASGAGSGTLKLEPAQMVAPGVERKVHRKSYAPGLFVSAIAPASSYSQVLRNVMATLELQQGNGKGGRVVATGSVMYGEGTTTVIANLANLAARSGQSSILVDLDMDKPDLSRRLRCTKGPGLVDVLDGSATCWEAVRRLPYTGLDFLPTVQTNRRSSVSDPSYISDIRALIGDLRNSYDYVFLDLPAIGASSKAKSLLSVIDDVVLVTRWGTTPRGVVQSFLSHETEIRAKLIGAVLNRVELRKLRRYGASAPQREQGRWSAAI